MNVACLVLENVGRGAQNRIPGRGGAREHGGGQLERRDGDCVGVGLETRRAISQSLAQTRRGALRLSTQGYY